MASILEEKLREACCSADIEAIQILLAQDVDVNSRNSVNGWTALHWACKRGHEEVVRILLNNGADAKIENFRGEKPASVCTAPTILNLLGEHPVPNTNNSLYAEDSSLKFTPNYIRNAPLNGQVDVGPKLRSRHTDFASMPTTALPAQTDGRSQIRVFTKLRVFHLASSICIDAVKILGKIMSLDLVLKVRIAGSSDPDYIEIEVPRWKLTYATLQKICCEELEVQDSQVERIRKLPNTRLRKDSDVKRLSDLQCLEVVLKAPICSEKYSNSYQSISTHKDQTILY